MRRLIVVIFIVALCVPSFAQTQKKTRNIAKTDAASVSARKTSVQYTEGLKAFYTGNTNEALKIFNGIILDNPKHDPSYFMLSKIYEEQKNYHDAVYQLQKAIKADKKNVWYKVALANVYMEMQEWSSAAKLWETICKEKDNNEYYLYALAECYYEMNMLEKVIDAYNRMEAIMGTNDELTRVKSSLWLYANKVKEAVGEYDRLIEMYPHNPDYYVKAGNIYQSNGMMPQAMLYYEKAAELNSEDPQLNLTMASYWEQQGDADKQMQCLLRVFRNANVDISQKKPYMRQMMTKALRDKNATALQSVAQLAEALTEANPDMGEGYAFQASICFAQQKYAEAIPLYEQALERDNTSYAIWQDYCSVLKNVNRLPEILKYEKDITELFPQNAELLCNIGLAYLQKDNAEKAIKYLKQAKTFAYESSQLAVIYTALSQAYEKIGDTESAADYAKKAKQKMN